MVLLFQRASNGFAHSKSFQWYWQGYVDVRRVSQMGPGKPNPRTNTCYNFMHIISGEHNAKAEEYTGWSGFGLTAL